MTRGAGPGSSMTPARGAAEGGAEGAYEPPKPFRAGRRPGSPWRRRRRGRFASSLCPVDA